MRINILITMSIILVFVFISGAVASEKSSCIYGSKIDEIISFYQARLYLVDSEFTILSDIGKDAQKRIDFLQSKKQFLISEMKTRNIELISSEIKSFICKKTTRLTGELAYNSP